MVFTLKFLLSLSLNDFPIFSLASLIINRYWIIELYTCHFYKSINTFGHNGVATDARLNVGYNTIQ